jgi:glycosyltransferase involved in cell wall biosynthesis
MTKIIYLIRRAEGGMAQHLGDLIKGLDRDRFAPVVIAPPGHGFIELLASRDVPVHEVDFPGQPNPLTDIGVVFRLAKLLRQLKPDIIHIHGHMAAMVGIAAQRLAARRIPVVVSIHNYPSYQSAGRLKRMFGSLTQRFLVHRSARLIAVSEDIRGNMIREEGIEPGKIVTVHNGIDLSGLPAAPSRASIDEIKKRYGIGPDDKVVGAIGRLVAFKGFPVLVEAAAVLKKRRGDFKVMIAGRGPEEENLSRQIKDLGVEEIIFLPGFVDDIAPYFAMSDVFVVPSVLEPFGLIVLQAIAAGRPVIGANAGGIPEIIRDGVTGVLVPPEDPPALADAIDKLLADEPKRQRLSDAAIKDLKERFPIEVMVAKTEEIYIECLRGGGQT